MFRHGRYRVRIPDSVFAPLTAGFLIMIVGLLGLVSHRPWIFASLGPTAFQLGEYPEQKSSRAYNVVAGHLSGLAMGFVAVAMLHAWSAPKVLATHDLTEIRVWASVLSLGLTSCVILVLRASHPAAGSTALLVALGSFSTWQDALNVIAGVLIVAILGEPLSYLRLRRMKEVTASTANRNTAGHT